MKKSKHFHTYTLNDHFEMFALFTANVKNSTKKHKYYVNYSVKNVETCIFNKQCKYFKTII